MGQEITIERNDDGEYHIFLDGEDHGPVDPESLRETGQNLYLHFIVYNNLPYEPVPVEKTTDDTRQEQTTINKEQVKQELRQLEQDLEDAEST